MKTNLDGFYKTDSKIEVEGVWLDFTDKTAFHVKRFGGANSVAVKKAMAQHYKPYARMIDNDTMPEKQQKRIMIRVFVESAVLGWKGIEIDGKDTAFSVDIAVDFFENLPEVFDAVMKHASDFGNFKEDLGN